MTDATGFIGIRLTESAFRHLPEYSCSLPTGTRLGKCWKKRVPYYTNQPLQMWLIGQYADDPHSDPKRPTVKIIWRRVMAVRPDKMSVP